MKYELTFKDIVEIFKRWGKPGDDLSAFEMASRFVDCISKAEKQEYVGEMNRRYQYPSETK